jgi:hypothetical protein
MLNIIITVLNCKGISVQSFTMSSNSFGKIVQNSNEENQSNVNKYFEMYCKGYHILKPVEELQKMQKIKSKIYAEQSKIPRLPPRGFPHFPYGICS